MSIGSGAPVGAANQDAARAETIAQEVRSAGYAVVPGLLPRDAVVRVGEDVAAVYQAHGWLKPDRPPAELVPDGRRRDGAPGWWRFAEDVQRLESLHRLAHHPALVGLARHIVGAPLLHHSRRHLMTINPSFWVPPHQEYTYIQGTADFFTAFVPLTADAAGRLRVLRESGARRIRPLRVLPTRGVEAVVEADESDWDECTVQPGDVVILHSLTTREVTANEGEGIQLAALFRFQSRRLPVVKASVKPEHYPRLPDWPVLTKGWSSTRWVRPPLLPRMVPYLMPPTLETWHEVLPTPTSAYLPVEAGSEPDDGPA